MERLTPSRTWWKRADDLFASSVRHKLLALVLAPLLLGVPALLLIVWLWGTQGYDRLMINKVSADLGAANEFFDRLLSDFGGRLDGFSQSHRLIAALDGTPDQRAQAIANAAQDQGLDYLLLLDDQGRVLAGTPMPAVTDRTGQPTVRQALGGKGVRGLEVFSPDDLSHLSPSLRDRAHLELRPTPNARPTDQIDENRGLLMTAAYPVRDDTGAVRAVVEGGVLLNRNLDVVDRLDALVYQGASLPLGSEGAATLFLDDIRVSTSIHLPDGQRALGTRVSKPVYDQVMGQGKAWMGRAPVVNRNYISGYMPLNDLNGQRVGMLYVGFLEAPLRTALFQALAGIFVAFLLVSAIGSITSLRWARTIFLPLERMAKVIERAENLDDCARVGATSSRDELGRMARAFDRLLDSLSMRREELRRWAGELDHMVAERTAELEAANGTLQRAQQQLVMNEKLTAIGELTAGVAHEINNPVAVMQGNLDLLKEILGPDQAPVENEIRLIDDQISRIQVIVNKLLQFARPGDFAGFAEDTDVNAAISDCLVLTRHNLRRGNITVDARLNATGSIEINRGELQQVLINLIVNAMQAIAESGTLTLETEDATPEQAGLFGADTVPGVVVRVRDSGQGIHAGDLGRIFDPFFTTKKQKGTGLGLSISYAIIKHYGGTIAVESQEGQGTTFTLFLRRQAIIADQSAAPVFSSHFPNRRGGWDLPDELPNSPES